MGTIFIDTSSEKFCSSTQSSTLLTHNTITETYLPLAVAVTLETWTAFAGQALLLQFFAGLSCSCHLFPVEFLNVLVDEGTCSSPLYNDPGKRSHSNWSTAFDDGLMPSSKILHHKLRTNEIQGVSWELCSKLGGADGHELCLWLIIKAIRHKNKKRKALKQHFHCKVQITATQLILWLLSRLPELPLTVSWLEYLVLP